MKSLLVSISITIVLMVISSVVMLSLFSLGADPKIAVIVGGALFMIGGFFLPEKIIQKVVDFKS